MSAVERGRHAGLTQALPPCCTPPHRFPWGSANTGSDRAHGTDALLSRPAGAAFDDALRELWARFQRDLLRPTAQVRL